MAKAESCIGSLDIVRMQLSIPMLRPWPYNESKNEQLRKEDTWQSSSISLDMGFTLK